MEAITPVPRRLRTGLIWVGITLLIISVAEDMMPAPFGVLNGTQHSGPLIVITVDLIAAALLFRLPRISLALLVTAAVAMAGIETWQAQVSIAQALPAAAVVCYLAAHRPRRTALPAVVLTVAALTALQVVRLVQHGEVGNNLLHLDKLACPATFMIVFAALIGRSIRQSRTASEAARVQAVTAERLRIARELHDMVAHSVGIIAIQAGMGRRVITTQPEEARKALAAIEATSREALSGLRRTLVGLRRDDPAGETAPAPGLDDVERITAAVADAGVRVEILVTGERRPLPADIDRSAYRIVQEAVTNVVRHAGIAHCQVHLRYALDALTVDITDDGRGAADHAAANGFGIVGMGERARLLNGQFSAGSRSDGGFRVLARLPMPDAVEVR